jgi:AraC-like DNA-binding protein
MAILDPWDRLWRIRLKPAAFWSRFLQDAFFLPQDADGSIRLSARGREAGIIPELRTLARGERHESPFHRHLHLELLLSLGDRLSYGEKGAGPAVPLPAGSVLFINHRRLHRLVAHGPGAWVSLRFTPAVVDELVGDDGLEALERFSNFHAFIETGARPPIHRLPEDAIPRARTACLAVCDRFVADGCRGGRFLTAAFLAALALLQEGAPPAPAGSGFERALANLRERLVRPPPLPVLARFAGMSRTAFSETFNREIGMTLPEYVARLRVEKAKRLLSGTNMPMTELALETGFYDSAHLSHVFRDRVGASPREYRAQAQGKRRK